MKLLNIFTVVALTPAFAWPSSSHSEPAHYHGWAPAGPNDVRAPCPMLNTLANHGYLPHSGKAITENDTVNALYTALNINQTLGEFLFSAALTTNPAPNATTFDLDDLDRHDILEHDASLSRGDFYFGNDHSFNQTIFDETRSYWTTPIIDVQQAANARLARVQTSNATNPTFGFSQTGTDFSFGETAAYIIVLGDKVAGTVGKSRVEYLFENERLPFELGWHKPDKQITFPDLDDMLDRIENATGSSPNQAASKLRRADLHAGRL